MANLNGIIVPNHYTGIGLHDTPGAENAAWGYEQSVAHARELREHGVTLYKLFGSGTKGERARAYRDNGIVVIHRYWPGGPHWGKPPTEWLMPLIEYDYLRANGVSLFEPGWNEFNLQDEWAFDIPGAAGIAMKVVDAWMAAGVRYGGYDHLLFPSNTPGGHVDHRTCYRAIAAELAYRRLQHTVKHVAIHPRPLNNPPLTPWSETNTCTFDEWRWIRDTFKAVGIDAYYWATEHGYSLDYNQNAEYPPINLASWTEYNWNLFTWMNPNSTHAIEPEFAGMMYWFNAGWGHWGPWEKDALVDSPAPEMPAPSPLWIRMKDYTNALSFSRYEETPAQKLAKLLDVNQFSGSTINWPLVKADGYVGVLIRVSGPDADGVTLIVDKCWENNYAGAADTGFLIGGYHGLIQEPTGQARLFVDAVGGRPLELGYYGDFEKSVTDSKANAFLVAADRNMASWGIEPPVCHVYTSLGWLSGKEAAWASGRDLWLAAWTYDLDRTPTVPAQWADWKFWQWSNQGTDVPGIEKRVCLDVYNGGNREFYQEFTPDNGGEEMWDSVGFEDVQLIGVSRERFDGFWGKNMKRFVPSKLPAGSVYYKLIRLSWRDGWCGLSLKVVDENENPISGEQVFQGWRDGDSLPADVAPLGGQPEGYTNNGNGGFTNAEGVHGWGWGAGEWFDPTVKEGPHWYWRGGENGAYSDVVCGFGWWDEHEVLEPTFMRVIVGEEPGPTPSQEPTPSPEPECDLTEVLERIDTLERTLTTSLDIIEEKVDKIARHFA